MIIFLRISCVGFGVDIATNFIRFSAAWQLCKGNVGNIGNHFLILYERKCCFYPTGIVVFICNSKNNNLFRYTKYSLKLITNITQDFSLSTFRQSLWYSKLKILCWFGLRTNIFQVGFFPFFHVLK